MTKAISVGWPGLIGKVSFHFPQVFSLISDRSGWHNGSTPGSRCLIIFCSTVHFDLNILSFPMYFGAGRRAVPNGLFRDEFLQDSGHFRS